MTEMLCPWRIAVWKRRESAHTPVEEHGRATGTKRAHDVVCSSDQLVKASSEGAQSRSGNSQCFTSTSTSRRSSDDQRLGRRFGS